MSRGIAPEDRMLTPAEVAALFRVDPKTVIRWAKAELLHPVRTPGGHRRYRETEVRALLASETGERLSSSLGPALSPRTRSYAMRKFAYTLVAALAAAGMALAAAGPASATTPPSAGVSSFARYTNANTDPVAGWFASADGGGYFTHVYGYIGSNGTASLNQLSASPANGAGLGMCNQSTGYAAQIGDIYTGGGSMEVAYGFGTFGPAKSFSDPCANGVVDPAPGVLLHASIRDTIVGQILYNAYQDHNGCRPGDALFEAEDLTSSPGVWHSSGCVPVGRGALYDETDVGVVADTTGMSAPAANLLAVFAHVGLSENLNGGGTAHGSFQTDPNWTVFPVFSTGTGNGPESAALLAPTAFANDHTTVLAGTPTG